MKQIFREKYLVRWVTLVFVLAYAALLLTNDAEAQQIDQVQVQGSAPKYGPRATTAPAIKVSNKQQQQHH